MEQRIESNMECKVEKVMETRKGRRRMREKDDRRGFLPSLSDDEFRRGSPNRVSVHKRGSQLILHVEVTHGLLSMEWIVVSITVVRSSFVWLEETRGRGRRGRRG